MVIYTRLYIYTSKHDATWNWFHFQLNESLYVKHGSYWITAVTDPQLSGGYTMGSPDMIKLVKDGAKQFMSLKEVRGGIRVILLHTKKVTKTCKLEKTFVYKEPRCYFSPKKSDAV